MTTTLREGEKRAAQQNVSSRTVARRVLAGLGGILLAVWGAATIGFLALKAIPGDPVDVMLGVQAQVSESVRAQIREQWGLNQPLWMQYFGYLARLARGDLGESYQLRQPVAEVIGSQLGPTLALAGLALLFALAFVVAAAMLVRTRWQRSIASTVELIAVSSPTFWIGLVLLSIFAFRLGWFPVASTRGFVALVLPAITLAIPVAGILGQVLRQGLDAASARPFALTARARGLGHASVVARHTLRHAAADSITLTGYLLGTLLGGVVLVETVFGRAGIGRVTLRAIIDRDLPVVLGVLVLSAATFAIINMLVDLAYPLIDPRLRRVGGAV